MGRSSQINPSFHPGPTRWRQGKRISLEGSTDTTCFRILALLLGFGNPLDFFHSSIQYRGVKWPGRGRTYPLSTSPPSNIAKLPREANYIRS